MFDLLFGTLNIQTASTMARKVKVEIAFIGAKINDIKVEIQKDKKKVSIFYFIS